MEGCKVLDSPFLERANKALHLTAYSVRSCIAPASGSR